MVSKTVRQLFSLRHPRPGHPSDERLVRQNPDSDIIEQGQSGSLSDRCCNLLKEEEDQSYNEQHNISAGYAALKDKTGDGQACVKEYQDVRPGVSSECQYANA